MAEGGYGERDPLLAHTDDRNDDNDGDTTGPFHPGSSSTPGPGERIPMRTTTNNNNGLWSLLSQKIKIHILCYRQ